MPFRGTFLTGELTDPPHLSLSTGKAYARRDFFALGLLSISLAARETDRDAGGTGVGATRVAARLTDAGTGSASPSLSSSSSSSLSLRRLLFLRLPPALVPASAGLPSTAALLPLPLLLETGVAASMLCDATRRSDTGDGSIAASPDAFTALGLRIDPEPDDSAATLSVLAFPRTRPVGGLAALGSATSVFPPETAAGARDFVLAMRFAEIGVAADASALASICSSAPSP